jgi:K+-transporting ATPase c subunit
MRELYTALRVTLLLTLIGGAAYPALVYGLALTFLPAFALGPLAEQLRILGR